MRALQLIVSYLNILASIQMILMQACNTLKWVISAEYTQKEVSIYRIAPRNST
jgi:hypothetical protein